MIGTSMSTSTISPDGQTAAYSQIDPASGRSRLFTRRIAETEAHRVTTGEWSERYPVWSPDSQTIAFEVKQDDATHIAVVPVAGAPPRQLTFETGESWPYGWSPDGDKILFAGLRHGIWNLHWVTVSGNATRRLTEYTSANTFVRYPSWSPRGTLSPTSWQR
jgi:Tol biopolymer transport system component